MYEPRLLFDNRFADATPVASSTAAGNFNVLNLADSRTNSWWKPTALPATVTVDCGVAKLADALGIAGHDLGSKGATVEVRGSTDNFVASDVLLASLSPTTDTPLFSRFTSAGYRYRRLKFLGCENRHTNSEETTYSALETAGDTFVRNTGIGMSGGLTADKFVIGTTNGFHRIRPTPLSSQVAGSTYTRTWYIRPSGIDRISLYEWAATSAIQCGSIYLNGAGSFSANPYTSGATPPTILGWGISLLSNGIYKVWFSWQCAVTGNYQPMLYGLNAAQSQTFTGDGIAGIEICGIQFEESPNPSTYIPTAATAVTNAPSIAIAMLGSALTFPSSVENGFDPVGLKTISTSSVSRKGNPLGSVIDYQMWNETLSFDYIDESWFRNNWLPNWQKMRGQPMIWAWDNDAHPDDNYLVLMDDGFSAKHKDGWRIKLGFALSGVSNL